MQQKWRLAAVCGSGVVCSDDLNLLGHGFSASCGTFSNHGFDVSLFFFFFFFFFKNSQNRPFPIILLLVASNNLFVG